MDKNIRDSILAANDIEYMLKTFSTQVLICAVVLGLKFRSWLLFGFLFLAPIFVLIFSKKSKWCKMVANILCVCYILLWGTCGVIIGKIFTITAAIVLGIIFLLIGAVYNIAVILYSREQ